MTRLPQGRALLAPAPGTISPARRYLAAAAMRAGRRRADELGRLLLAQRGRLAGPPEGFRVFVVKPVGNRCNLRCDYCFFPTHDAMPVMPPEVLQALFRRVAEAGLPAVEFVWHGGEPLLAGRPFYRLVLELQRSLLPGVRVKNTLMTNGTLLDDAWAAFLVEHGFRVGVSVDGPPAVHDRHRHDAAGQGSFAAMAEGCRRLQAVGLRVGTVTVYSPDRASPPEELVDTLAKLDAHSFRLNPCLEGGGAGYPEFALGCAHAALERGGDLQFSVFDDVFSALLGYGARVCWMAGTCRYLVGVEPDGGVWACCERHNGQPVLHLGNVTAAGLADIWHGERATAFRAGDDARRAECAGCEWSFLCAGGCLYHRVVAEGSPAGRDPLCPQYAASFRLLSDLAEAAVHAEEG